MCRVESNEFNCIESEKWSNHAIYFSINIRWSAIQHRHAIVCWYKHARTHTYKLTSNYHTYADIQYPYLILPWWRWMHLLSNDNNENKLSLSIEWTLLLTILIMTTNVERISQFPFVVSPDSLAQINRKLRMTRSEHHTCPCEMLWICVFECCIDCAPQYHISFNLPSSSSFGLLDICTRVRHVLVLLHLSLFCKWFCFE